MIYRRMALRHTRLVVVTGSFGKTTTARTISVALGGTDQDVNSYNFKSYVALAILKTPPWRRFAVIEAAIDGVGQMIQYAKMIRPDVAIVSLSSCWDALSAVNSLSAIHGRFAVNIVRCSNGMEGKRRRNTNSAFAENEGL
jgi:hypothetical protein